MVFVDASALVKLYIAEQGSEQVAAEVTEGVVAISRLTLVEVTSAIERRRRAGELPVADRDAALHRLDEDETGMHVLDVLAPTLRRARSLCGSHPLRAGDAIQLASCLQIRDRTGARVRFVCFDDRLNRAAAAEGLELAVPLDSG